MKSSVTISLVPEAKGGPFVFWDLEEGMATAAELGFDAVEIFPTSADDVDARELKRLLELHKLKIAAVGTGAGWVKHKLRLTDPDPLIRRRAVQFVAAIIDFAGSFGAPAIIGSMQGRWEAGVSREQALAWLAEALEQLGPRAHAQGVPLLYEFLNRYETNILNCVTDALDFLKTLRTQNVLLLCDLFHMNIEEVDIPNSLLIAGKKLGHVHFVDSNRKAVGMGHTQMAPIMSALGEIGYKGYLSAEIVPVPSSKVAAQNAIEAFRKYAFKA
jgi:sugar phosphate isomerase/epimerase